VAWFDLLMGHLFASHVFALPFLWQTLIILCSFRNCLDQNEMWWHDHHDSSLMNNASYSGHSVKLLEFLAVSVVDSFMCL
jgi:hypothetical protein